MHKNLKVILLTLILIFGTAIILPAQDSDIGEESGFLDKLYIGVYGGLNISLMNFQDPQDENAINPYNYENGFESLTTSILAEYIIMDFLSAGIIFNYAQKTYTSTTVTMKDTNVVNEENNLYIDPFDMVEKRGGLGVFSADYFNFMLYAQGYYRIPIGDKFAITPYMNLGFQLGMLLSAQFDIQEVGPVMYESLNTVIPIIYIALGGSFDIGFGEIFLQTDFNFPVVGEEEYNFHSESSLEYPIDFIIPGFNIYNIGISLGYKLLLGKIL